MSPVAVVIVAGGSGTRMGADRPKQYLDLCGMPILCHTVAAFGRLLSSGEPIIVVVPEEDRAYVRTMLSRYCPAVPEVTIIAGGASRAHSVQNGLLAVPETIAYIAVHDGVRPLVSSALWHRLLTVLDAGHQAVVPALRPIESVRMLEGGSYESVDRDRVRLVQTPQAFDARLLIEAYRRYGADPRPHLTDDAGIVTEYMGVRPRVVEGIEQNIKITTPRDLRLAEWYLAEKSPSADTSD